MSTVAEIRGSNFANELVRRFLRPIEVVAVIMRIISFTLVSWLGPASPFLFVWIFNTIDAVMLTWCAVLRRDPAYLLLNSFWIVVGAIGIARTTGWL